MGLQTSSQEINFETSEIPIQNSILMKFDFEDESPLVIQKGYRALKDTNFQDGNSKVTQFSRQSSSIARLTREFIRPLPYISLTISLVFWVSLRSFPMLWI